jgi:hypothetical protein
MKSAALTTGLFLMFLAVATVREAEAKCFLNGVAYPTGTKVGPYVCLPDGRWRR